MLVGLLIGLALSKFIKDRWLIPVCMITSIIPDILDKPLALQYSSLGSGRTVGHTLLFICICIFISSIFWYNRHRIVLVGVALSLFLHQLGDEIWNLPTTWFYPLLGTFLLDQGLGVPGHWFWTTFWIEVTSPVEWLSVTVIILLLILIEYTKRRKDESKTDTDFKENVDGRLPGQ
jgi:membrane-bound metal-dependent hydrolase YbcI (DUF457 family)